MTNHPKTETGGYPHSLDGVSTDKSGRLELFVPESERIQSVMAWKDDVGFDYEVYSLDRNQQADLKTKVPEFPDAGETLRLDGAAPPCKLNKQKLLVVVGKANVFRMSTKHASNSYRHAMDNHFFTFARTSAFTTAGWNDGTAVLRNSKKSIQENS